MKTIENLNTMVKGTIYAGWIIDHEKKSSFLSRMVLIEITENGEYIIATNVGFIILDKDHEVVLSKTDHEWTHYSGGRYSIIVYAKEEEEN